MEERIIDVYYSNLTPTVLFVLVRNIESGDNFAHNEERGKYYIPHCGTLFYDSAIIFFKMSYIRLLTLLGDEKQITKILYKKYR